MSHVNVDALEEVLGESKNGDSDNHAFCCPFCESIRGRPDVDFKLWVHKENGKWQCFKCETRGRAVRSLFKLLGQEYVSRIPEDFRESVRRLLYPVKSNTGVSTAEEEIKPIYPPEGLSEIEKGSDVYEYLAGDRGLGMEHIRYYGLKKLVVEGKKGNFSCVYIPVFEYGHLTFYQYRAVDFKMYKNYKGSNKTKHVFNIDHPYDWTIICEGVFSAISAGLNGVALFGKAFSERQLDLLDERDDQVYFCCLEPDFFHKNIELAEELRKRGKKVYVIVLDYGKDPNDYSPGEFRKLLEEAIPYDNSAYTQAKLRMHQSWFDKLNVNTVKDRFKI